MISVSQKLSQQSGRHSHVTILHDRREPRRRRAGGERDRLWLVSAQASTVKARDELSSLDQGTSSAGHGRNQIWNVIQKNSKEGRLSCPYANFDGPSANVGGR